MNKQLVHFEFTMFSNCNNQNLITNFDYKKNPKSNK